MVRLEDERPYPATRYQIVVTDTSSVVVGPPGTSSKTLLNLLVTDSACPPQAQLAYHQLILAPFYQARSQNCEKRLLINFIRPSICLPVFLSPWNNSAPTGRFSTTFYTWALFEKSAAEVQDLFQSNKNSRYYIRWGKFQSKHNYTYG